MTLLHALILVITFAGWNNVYFGACRYGHVILVKLVSGEAVAVVMETGMVRDCWPKIWDCARHLLTPICEPS